MRTSQSTPILAFIRQRLLLAFFLLAALEGLVCLVLVFSIPGDPKNAFLFGFSVLRLGMAVFMLAAVAALLAVGWAVRRPADPLAQRLSAALAQPNLRHWYQWAGLAAVWITWITMQLPAYRLGRLAYLVERLQPLLVWIGLLGLQTFLAVWLAYGQAHGGQVKRLVRAERGWGRATLAAAAFILLLALLVVVTGAGVTPDIMHWNVGGVPLTSLQMLLVWTGLAIVLAASLALAGKPALLPRPWMADALLALLVWVSAALLWNLTPLPRSFFAPGPFPPENVFYPYSDAAVHDMGSYYLLLGEEINNRVPTDKPLYMLLLAGLHAVSRDDYQSIITLQILVLAAFPVLLYFFGKSFHSRAFGLLVALLAILKERNAIAATIEIRVSHSKLLMSEFPTALGVVLFSWLLFEWLKDPDRRPMLPLWAGGVIGLTALVRPNALLLLPMALLLVVLVFGRRLRRSIPAGVLITAGLLATFVPWMVYTETLASTSFITIKIRDVINRQSPTVEPTRPELLPPPDEPSGLSLERPLAAGGLKALQRPVMQVPEESLFERYRFVLDHFLHNQVTAVLGLTPGLLPYHDLKHTLNQPYWIENPFWDGALTRQQALLLAVNLAVIAAGLGLAWSRWRYAGLAPLAAQIGYSLANALARTSGARYLVPFDWAVYFYYALGLLQLTLLLVVFFHGLRRPASQPAVVQARPSSPPAARYLVTLALLLAGGSLIPLVSISAPPRLPAFTRAALAERLQNVPQPAGVPIEQILADPNMVVVSGLEIYPRYFYEDQPAFFATKEVGVQPPSGVPRLGFTLLTAELPLGISLPLDSIPAFPDGQSMVAVGCRSGNIVDALLAVSTEPGGPAYWRSPWPAEFTCPPVP